MSKNDGGELASRVASPGEPYRDLRVNPTPGGDPEHECTFDFGDGTVCGFEAYIVSPGYGGVGWNGEAWCDDHDPRSGAKPGAAGDGTPSLSKTEGEGGAPPTSAASLDEVLPVVAVGDKYLIQVTATVESIDGDLVHFSTETELWLRLFQAAVQSQQGAIRAFNAKPAEGGTNRLSLLESQIAEIRDLHRPWALADIDHLCRACFIESPCPTIAILDKAEGECDLPSVGATPAEQSGETK